MILPQASSSIPHSKLILNTCFLIDAFRHSYDFSISYFLSHLHSDHYTGLTFFWSRGIIFCSPTTTTLLIRILNIPLPFIYLLSLHQPVLIDGSSITLIDANHCPGDFQFLFHVPQSMRYVHTGYFRFNPKMILDPALVQFIGVGVVFLDTTYRHPKFVFPSQDESINYVVDAMNQCDGENVLFLVSTYVIGKENILLKLPRKFGKKVHVDARKWRFLRLLGMERAMRMKKH